MLLSLRCIQHEFHLIYMTNIIFFIIMNSGYMLEWLFWWFTIESVFDFAIFTNKLLFSQFYFPKIKSWIGFWHYFSCLRIAFNYVDGEFHLQSSKSLFVHIPSPGGPDNHVHDEAFQREAAPHKASSPVAPLPPLSPLQLHLCWPPPLAGPHVILYHYWLF